MGLSKLNFIHTFIKRDTKRVQTWGRGDQFFYYIEIYTTNYFSKERSMLLSMKMTSYGIRRIGKKAI